MENTKAQQDAEKYQDRLEKANTALTAYRERIQSIIADGPDYLSDYARDAWAIIEGHTEITKANGIALEDGVKEVNKTHRAAIYYGLVERGELDTGFALLHDTIHDAANLTNGIYFISKKWGKQGN